MLKSYPNIFAHESSCRHGNFVLQDRIIIKGLDFQTRSRECPHRAYLMHKPGEVVKNLECKLHGFCWDNQGLPIGNHPYRLLDHTSITKGVSGLLFQQFEEPIGSRWVTDIANETNLEYSHSVTGSSNASWLWLMDILGDVLHIRPDGIHPALYPTVTLDKIDIEYGDGWCCQYHDNGFWLFVYPFHSIEWSNGKLSIMRITPNSTNEEFGFTWQCQLYYTAGIDSNQRKEWETLVNVYNEDIAAAENIRRSFFPLSRSTSRLEDPTVHWGKWFKENRV